jgi:hypothetical protein
MAMRWLAFSFWGLSGPHYVRKRPTLFENSPKTAREEFRSLGAGCGFEPHLTQFRFFKADIPRNLLTGLATYAAMSRELGLPLRYPGGRDGWNSLQQTADAELFGRATLWALGEEKARIEIFNVSNGDVYRWPLAMSAVSEMSEKAPLWLDELCRGSHVCLRHVWVLSQLTVMSSNRRLSKKVLETNRRLYLFHFSCPLNHLCLVTK